MNRLEDIKDYIVSLGWARSKENLNASTRVSEDIGIDGDDAEEFMQAFSKKFNVDLSSFIFKEYFVTEGFDPFTFLMYMLNIRKKKSITLSDLERAVEDGKWIGS